MIKLQSKSNSKESLTPLEKLIRQTQSALKGEPVLSEVSTEKRSNRVTWGGHHLLTTLYFAGNFLIE